MSESQSEKDFPIFSQTRSQTAENRKPLTNTGKGKAAKHDDEEANASNMELILAEIKMVGSRLDGIDGCLNGIASSISSVEGSLANLTGRVVETENRLDEAEHRISATEDASNSHGTQLAAMKKMVDHLQLKVDDLENRGRRKNLKIVGLPEKAEGSTPLVKFLQSMLPTWLGLPEGNPPLDIERAHRSLAPVPAPNGPPRSILVRFLRYPEKEAVLQAALKKRDVTHDGTRLRFYTDLSADVLRRRREFDTVGKALARRNMYRGFAYPARLRCLHNGKLRLFDDPDSASAFVGTLE